MRYPLLQLVQILIMAALVALFVSLFSKQSKIPVKPELKTDLTKPKIVQHMTVEEEVLKSYRNVFVIGDVHGCYDELMELLLKAKAIGDHTLKVFAGDMFCKGPKSHDVLKELIKMKHIAVRGNHEEAVIKKLHVLRDDPEHGLSNKFSWLQDLSEDEKAYIENLPYTITFPSIQAIIVHAGLLPGKPLERQSPDDMVHMRNIITNDYFGEGGLVASADHINGTAWAGHWSGPSHVYFGHDARRGLQKYEYATGLDTGCVYGNSLTGVFIYGPWAGEFVSIKAKVL